MAIGIGSKTDRVTQLAMGAIQHIAKRDKIPERFVKAMNFRVECHYDMHRMGTRLRCAWRDPFDGSHVRNFDMLIDDYSMDDTDDLQGRILLSIDNINLRGELFFFKLHKHFPNRIDKVRCDGHGHITVTFKNGRELVTDEQDIDSIEFLATCGMVYDL